MLVGIETLRGQPPALPQLATDLVRRFPRVVGVVRRETDRAGTVIEHSESHFSGVHPRKEFWRSE